MLVETTTAMEALATALQRRLRAERILDVFAIPHEMMEPDTYAIEVARERALFDVFRQAVAVWERGLSQRRRRRHHQGHARHNGRPVKRRRS